ncbi:MAG TPA: helix-turn-helix transcriptional regulator [Thermomicrobiales bacterium]|nr:helix-turn-helix transcriptional regulator [Thermomicrobiales bacterium]
MSDHHTLREMDWERLGDEEDERPITRQRVGATVREESGVTLETLAGQTGISASHTSRMERGLTMPSDDALARIATALGSALPTLAAEEATTKAVDANLDAILTRFGVSEDARVDLLRQTPITRAEPATVLDRD